LLRNLAETFHGKFGLAVLLRADTRAQAADQTDAAKTIA
jgi:hypothetical protein